MIGVCGIRQAVIFVHGNLGLTGGDADSVVVHVVSAHVGKLLVDFVHHWYDLGQLRCLARELEGRIVKNLCEKAIKLANSSNERRAQVSKGGRQQEKAD